MMSQNKSSFKVTASIGEITLQTYALLGENRNPVFESRYGVAHIYPYTLQDEIATEPKKVKYLTLNLENEYLQLTVLPELGGRVYSLFDKISGREVFYKNPTVKFSPLAIRGAFFSGGLEFSFPVAHAPTTASPINWDLKEHPDGSASITIGGIEHMAGMRWSIRLTLYPGRCALSQDVWLQNPTPVPGRYHYWTNASLLSDDESEFIYPFQRIRSYEFEGTASWPVARLDLINREPGLPGMEGVPMWPAERMHDRINFRWEKDMLAQVSIFGRNVRWDYFGIWQHSSNTGYAHIARSKDVAGMKLWSWGRSEVGLVNQTALMDDGSYYAETQCGAMETQLDFDFLPPGSTKEWREWWLPLRGMGGLTCASQHMGARLSLKPGNKENTVNITLGLCPSYAVENCSFELKIPGKTLMDNRNLSMTPDQPYTTEFSLSSKVLSNKDITLIVKDSEQRVILENIFERESDPIIPSENSGESTLTNAQDYYELGLKNENFDERAHALDSYSEALKLDPSFGPAHFQLGLLLLRSADYSGAHQHFIAARDQGIIESNYYLGIISRYQEDFGAAGEYFSRLNQNDPLGTPASFGKVSCAFYDRDWDKAISILQDTDKTMGETNLYNLLSGIAFRAAGNPKKASELFEQILDQEPLNLIALRELSIGDNPSSHERRNTLERLLQDDRQYLLDMICFYLDYGLFIDALNVIIDLKKDWAHPIPDYLASYICSILGKDSEASDWSTQAQQKDPDGVFPNRLWEINALQYAIKQTPGDHKGKFYLGNFLYSRQRYEEAIQSWEDALPGLKDYDVLYRNLGYGFWQYKGDLEGAAQFFEMGLKLNPNNQDLYIHLDEIYKIQGQSDKRSSLLDDIKTLDLIREDVRKKFIAILVDLDRYDEALEILENQFFLPLEMDQSFHILFTRALLKKAQDQIETGEIQSALQTFQHALDYPQNHGVGRPIKMADAEIFYRLGCAHELLGEYAQAIQAWQSAGNEHHDFGEDLYGFVQKSLDKLSRYSELGFTV